MLEHVKSTERYEANNQEYLGSSMIRTPKQGAKQNREQEARFQETQYKISISDGPAHNIMDVHRVTDSGKKISMNEAIENNKHHNNNVEKSQQSSSNDT